MGLLYKFREREVKRGNLKKEDLIMEIPNDEEVDYIDDMLMEHNRLSKPFEQKEPYINIRRCIKDSKGQVIAGILAYSVMWQILYIDTLWVNEEHRSKGYGSLLLKEVENEAKNIGCHIAHLDTFDFQGPEFYIKNGYEVFGVLKDSPKGHKEYFLTKRL